MNSLPLHLWEMEYTEIDVILKKSSSKIQPCTRKQYLRKLVHCGQLISTCTNGSAKIEVRIVDEISRLPSGFYR